MYPRAHRHKLQFLTVTSTLAATLAACLTTLAHTQEQDPVPTALDAVTFAQDPSKLYVPVRDVAEALDLPVEWDSTTGRINLSHVNLAEDRMEELVDGSKLVYVRDLEGAGIRVDWNGDHQSVALRAGDRQVKARAGNKRVEIDRSMQTLRAWQGERLVLETHVSTGRQGHATPTGDFRAGLKLRMHHSTLYDNAPMPWSVQVIGNVFIHGFTSVPDYPASHGCIRMRLTGGNPAYWFFRWVEVGTPIRVVQNSRTTPG